MLASSLKCLYKFVLTSASQRERPGRQLEPDLVLHESAQCLVMLTTSMQHIVRTDTPEGQTLRILELRVPHRASEHLQMRAMRALYFARWHS